MPTLDCLHRHIFLFHVYRSVSLARMRRYMQLAYLLHQCAKSLLSRDSRIADCTVRHPGVERPFFSLMCMYKEIVVRNLFSFWKTRENVKKCDSLQIRNLKLSAVHKNIFHFLFLDFWRISNFFFKTFYFL